MNNQGMWGAGFIESGGWSDPWFPGGDVTWLEYFLGLGTETRYSGIRILCLGPLKESVVWVGNLTHRNRLERETCCRATGDPPGFISYIHKKAARDIEHSFLALNYIIICSRWQSQ